MDFKRPSIDEYYLNIAKDVSKRSTCLRRRFGAVIVRAGTIVATGYVGAPRGSINCIDRGICTRQALNIEPGTRYELCESVHAEMNAVINAARTGTPVLGGVMYLYGENTSDDSMVENIAPCKMCARVIVNSGIRRVVIMNPDKEIIYLEKNYLLEISTSESKKGY
ncbi:MAG: dCMP deaminase family protein [Candidatus Coatesbacteria bacterium]|nr:dCMP deaminase family protein [Candidatus Coatesbacteria bacterium]